MPRASLTTSQRALDDDDPRVAHEGPSQPAPRARLVSPGRRLSPVAFTRRVRADRCRRTPRRPGSPPTAAQELRGLPREALTNSATAGVNTARRQAGLGRPPPFSRARARARRPWRGEGARGMPWVSRKRGLACVSRQAWTDEAPARCASTKPSASVWSRVPGCAVGGDHVGEAAAQQVHRRSPGRRARCCRAASRR